MPEMILRSVNRKPYCHRRSKILSSTAAALSCTASAAALTSLLGVAPALAQTIDGGATVTVPGSQSSPWNIPGSLSVGNLSTGTLQIGPGGVVSSGSGFIGRQTTGIGTVTVTGAGAQWTSGPGLSVGNFGNGTLGITNGGHVTSTTNSYIAVGAGSIGAATVSGVGSQWNTTGFLRVGNTGNGTLGITDGAVVSNGLGYVGYDTAAVGLVTVTGAGSSWNNTSDLSVGTSGTGTLNITNGGAVSSVAGIVGSTANGRGTVTVNGAGSTWTNSSTLTVGAFGNGALTISNNATVSAVSARVAANSGSHGVINIGAAATDPAAAPGTLILTGPAPALTLGATGTLVFNHTDNSGSYQFTHGITGAGKLETYSGTTVLTGTSNYTGGTTISGGTLQLGSGGTAGSIVGNVTNNGALVFDRSDTVTFPGVISGTGMVSQIGTGTTVLTGNNSYTGGTTISSGTLQLGSGGATGSIVGNVFNNAALAFNRSDVFTFGGVISGTGAVNQIGSGTTVLTGANSYTGATTVANGGLYVDGNQAAATGATSVATGATLGGSGTIGGNVTLADGATLSPGSLSTTPGTLAINGNLSLSGGSLLAYSFGQANVVGGALNDLVTVGGDLILDGTLNVVTSPGGSFDTGIYRVISYAGGLTNNGLAIGTIPSPNYFVQTSVPGQVNLVNTSGLTLNYWDGAIGPKNNGIVNGGDGLWQTSAGNDNWTEATGTPNAPFSDGAFAIFTGVPGTVTVDNSLGAVTASGMQFAVDGYLITGDTLTLVDSPLFPGISVIRVGDGTSAGSGYTATIDAVLAGSTQLVKADLGTVVLNGANTYSGGTLIRGGTISIASDGNLGATTGALAFDGGTLLTTADLASARVTTLAAGGGTIETAAATQFVHSGTISGPGALTKSGAGILTLLADNTYAGGTTITAGTLQLGNGGTSGAIVGDVTNNGTLAFNRSDTMTFAGAISGTGSLNQIGTGTTILTADNSYTGGTTIAAGMLQLGNGGTSGAIVGDVTNNGTLVFNRSDTLTFAGAISGTGGVNQIGTGTTVLTSTGNSYSGATNIDAGVLQAGGVGTLSANSAITVAAGGTLDVAGFSQIVAGLTNAGLVSMGSGTPPGTTLTTPNYVGQNGTIALNTLLGADGSPSDRLVINGGSGTGTSSLLVSNVGGLGAVTAGNGILVVDAINGATTTAGAFLLGNPGGYVAAGPYAYTLFRSSVDGSGPQNWYLRSHIDCTLDPTNPACNGPDPTPPNPRPEVSTDVVVPELALRYGAAILDTLHERMGEERFFNRPATEDSNSFAWGRLIGVTGERDGSPLGVLDSESPNYDYRIYALQSGFDLYQEENADGSLDHAGIYAAFGRATADVDHFDGSFAGQAALNGVTLGGYWTHVGKEGWYLDALAQGTWYDVNNNGSPAGLNLDTNGFGFAASLESGYPFRLNDEWVIEPQAQLVFQTISLDDANDGAATVRYSDIDSLTGRLGVRLARTVELEEDRGDRRFVTTWMRASLVNEFLANPTTEFSSQDGFVPFHTDMKGLSAQLNVGVDVELEHNVSLYGSVGSDINLEGDGQSLTGKLGLKVAF